MEFTQTTLGEEYTLIQQEKIETYSSYEAIFVTDKGEYPVLSVISVDRVRDYRNAAADVTKLTVAMEYGKYLNQIVPFKENLKMIVIKRLVVKNKETDPAAPAKEQTFIAHITVNDETDTMQVRPETSSEEVSDRLGLKQLVVQLEEEAFSIARSEMVGGIFNDVTPFDTLMALLNTSLTTMELDLENKIQGISAVPPNNTSKRKHILLPHGIPLVSVANKLQTQFGGIYNGGIGCYLQKGFWYVWPLYNFGLFDTAKKTGMFVLMPGTRYSGVEHTYRMVGENFVAVITGGFERIDVSETRLLNEGSSARFANTDTALESFVKVEGNKALAHRHDNTNEYEAIQRKGSKMSRVNDNTTESNPFNEASKLAERSAAYFSINWENSNPDLIFPGLQVELAFMAGGEECFLNGVVVYAHDYSALSGMGLHQKAHQNTTNLVVMVDRLAPTYKKYIDSEQSQ